MIEEDLFRSNYEISFERVYAEGIFAVNAFSFYNGVSPINAQSGRQPAFLIDLENIDFQKEGDKKSAKALVGLAMGLIFLVEVEMLVVTLCDFAGKEIVKEVYAIKYCFTQESIASHKRVFIGRQDGFCLMIPGSQP